MIIRWGPEWRIHRAGKRAVMCRIQHDRECDRDHISGIAVSRRCPAPVRRIRTIALVHESLSREPGDDIAFIEIVRPLLRLAEEGLQSPDRPRHWLEARPAAGLAAAQAWLALPPKTGLAS